MAFKTTISKDCIEFIKQQAKQGINFTDIMKICKDKFTPNPSYTQVVYHANKVYSQKKKRTIELNFIESTTALCQEMTTWIRGLKKEYDELNPDELVGEIMKLKQVIIGTEEEIQQSEEEFKLRMKILQFKRGDKSNLRYSLNKAFENFVNLLKTPAIQTTQVNILQQQLEQSLGDIIHDRTTSPIKIPS
jgi:urease gamma subunit